MSTQSQQGPGPHDSHASDVDATSEFNRASVATQIAMVTAAWVLTDVAALAVHAVRLRQGARSRSGRMGP